MVRLTKEQLTRILTEKLGLLNPEFRLQREKEGVRWTGNVISATFRGKRDNKRQDMIWDALADEFGEAAARLVGLLLAYTPDEWNLGAEPTHANTKKAG
jgi:acid stress-induced BolA-like protein IbaG/YrbA